MCEREREIVFVCVCLSVSVGVCVGTLKYSLTLHYESVQSETHGLHAQVSLKRRIQAYYPVTISCDYVNDPPGPTQSTNTANCLCHGSSASVLKENESKSMTVLNSVTLLNCLKQMEQYRRTEKE